MALSGGGDSLALLRLAATWAKANGRRLLALTVDHGLGPDSAAWTAFAARAARDAGADWRGLRWEGPKPTTGLPAAARRARHRLIADAARAAGARVVLFAHTADDVAEAEVMRAAGSSLGRLRDWAPSPAWPEGRGLMLLRPMLGARRAEIRAWLAGQGADWIEDPANEDLRYARSRARQTLLPPEPEGGGAAEAGREGEGPTGPAVRPPDARILPGSARLRPDPLASGEGWFSVDRTLDARALAATVVCVGGGDRTPRRDRLDALLGRLAAGDDLTATLCGARLEAAGPRVRIVRESGEFTRRPPPPPPLALEPGVEAVWDGRWAVTVSRPGWSVVPAAGRLAALPDRDRAALASLPPAARGGLPVLIRNDSTGPVLAGTAGEARSLVEERLALALDRMTHEKDLAPRDHGAKPLNHLFSGADITE